MLPAPRIKQFRPGPTAIFLMASLLVQSAFIASDAWAQETRADNPLIENSRPLPLGAARLSLSSLSQPPAGWIGSPEGLAVAFGGSTLPSFTPTLPNPPDPTVRPQNPPPNIPESGTRRVHPRGDTSEESQNPNLPTHRTPNSPTPGAEGRTVTIDDARLPEGAVGRKVELGGGAAYYTYVPLQGENPLFTQVRANWERLNAAWSLRSFLLRRELKDHWVELQTRQAELITRARALDTTWPGLRIEARGEIYRRGWASLTSDLSAWHSAAQSYKGRCEGKPGGAACFQEYRRLLDEWSSIQSREGALFEEWGRAAEDGTRFYAKMESYFNEVEIWQAELIEFNRQLQAAGGIVSLDATQTNEILDQAKAEAQRTGQDVCDILEEWLRQANSDQDTARRMKIVQAQKFAGCRNRKKR